MEKKEDFTQELAEILVKHKIIERIEADSIKEMFKDSTKETFDEFLLEEGLVEEAELLRALSQYYKVHHLM